MSLKDLDLKSTYRTGKDNILKDFYIPVLESMKSYDRAVGYFSTSFLTYALQGIRSVVKNDGKIRLIVGFPLLQDEFEALEEAEVLSRLNQRILKDLESILEQTDSNLGELRVKVFTMLVATGRLQLKFAARKNGIYHEKVGIVEDSNGDKILFHGSNNETTNATNPDLNFESFSVYRSWQTEVYKEYAEEFEAGFERLWNNREDDIVTLDMPSEAYTRIASKYKKESQTFDHLDDENDLFDELKTSSERGYPKIPIEFKGHKFKLFSHQEDALREWWSHGRSGLFRLATGAGKTLTAMYGVAKTFEVLPSPRKMCVIISVPYVALAEQWVSELSMFNMKPIRCFSGNGDWFLKLNNAVSSLLIGNVEFISIVVVNRTLTSDKFQETIGRVDPQNIFFIGDECHRLAANQVFNSLPEASFKMGLSATPYIDSGDDYENENIEKERLLSYFGNVVAEFTLSEALAKGILTPYDYNVCPVRLTFDELDEYIRLTKEIGRLMNIDSSKDNASLANAIRERNQIVSSASNKKLVLRNLLSTINFSNKSHTLFYVGEGKSLDSNTEDEVKQLDELSSEIANAGWKISKFTSSESKFERTSIMSDFTNSHIDGLVAMRVLDEGIDIPQCQRAFILASSRNERQFIQRRGRILRKSPGKDMAEIYDFVVLPPLDAPLSEASVSLVEKELKRVMDFVRLSSNRTAVEDEVMELASDFNLDPRGY